MTKHDDEAARITVLPPCDCPACARGDRWFYCHGVTAGTRRPIAVYQCEDLPTPADVAHVSRLHPGAVLLYV